MTATNEPCVRAQTESKKSDTLHQRYQLVSERCQQNWHTAMSTVERRDGR